MNHKYNEIGKNVKIMSSEDAINILKQVSKNNMLYEIPDILIELIKSDFITILTAIKYSPNVYYYLPEHLKNNKKIMYDTLKSFRNHFKYRKIC